MNLCRDGDCDSSAGKIKEPKSLYCLQVDTYIDSLTVHALKLVPWLVNAFCSRAAPKLLIGAVEQDTHLLASVSYLFSKLFQSSASFLHTCFITYLLPYSMSFKAMSNCSRLLAKLLTDSHNSPFLFFFYLKCSAHHPLQGPLQTGQQTLNNK